MRVVAKFKVEQCIPGDHGGGDVVLSVVTSGSPENEQFYKWTPSGTIRMSCIASGAFEQFKEGQEKFVYFEDVPAPAVVEEPEKAVTPPDLA